MDDVTAESELQGTFLAAVEFPREAITETLEHPSGRMFDGSRQDSWSDSYLNGFSKSLLIGRLVWCGHEITPFYGWVKSKKPTINLIVGWHNTDIQLYGLWNM